MKINYDHYNFDEEMNNALLFFIMKYGSEEDKQDILDKEKDQEGVDRIEIAQLQLKPDSPDFIPTPENIMRSRLKNIKNKKPKIEDEKEDLSLHFFDLFDIVEMKCMKQFGLPEISINDLLFNNVQKGFLVVNAKGKLINIITNKDANPQFVKNLINLKLENNILNLSNNIEKPNKKSTYSNPFKIKKPLPYK